MSTSIQNTHQMRELRLNAMTQAYERQQETPKLHDLNFDDRFGLLLEAECAARRTRKLSRLVKTANLPEAASLEDLDTRPSRGLDKALVSSLAGCGWIQRQHNLIVVGPTGVGKTWLACALAHQACRQGMKVWFQKAADLYTSIVEASMEGTVSKLKTSLTTPNLLILDDFGIGEMTPYACQVLLDIVDRRMRTGSLLITSQYPTEKWHASFPDPTIADAVLDRVVHQAYRIQLKGESMRKMRGRAALAEA
ncbi:AAA family ATPase [Caenimonas sedimenti]|uniref:AAA family ATPase n=1 Tax=Caenimonas sedimenti TaxID=2596921 RepID=A0A562ZE69_9BURK|nr:IS21-like element helper ATPase IstB [Caenimonas sedimenti]TWO64409.1 AAA family ATPase [Caenimonas sedimenti]